MKIMSKSEFNTIKIKILEFFDVNYIFVQISSNDSLE